MNPQTDPEHRALWDLIPWVVAGSASAPDQHRVQEHLLRCEDCRDEMAFHQSLRAGMHSAARAPVSSSANINANMGTHGSANINANINAHINAHINSNTKTNAGDGGTVDDGLAQLWARVDEAQAVVDPAPPRSAAGPSSSGRQRWLVAAVLAQAIGLAAMAGLLLQRQPEAGYQTLSSGTPPSAAVMRLVPAPNMPVAQLSALLARHGLQIVESNHDGTVLGLARLPAPSAPAATANTTAPELAQRLRAEAGVLLAEPITTSTGR